MNISCFGDGKFFYSNNDGKLQLLNIKNQIFPVENEFTSVIFIECTGTIWNRRDASWFCVSIFIKDMGWYLEVIGNLLNDECIIYIFTGEVLNGTPNILTNQ